MSRIHVAAVTLALTGVGHAPLPHATRPTTRHAGERVTFALPASSDHLRHRHLIAIALLRGRTVHLTRPRIHGRHAVTRLTAHGLRKAGLQKTNARGHARAELFAGRRRVATTHFAVAGFGRPPVARRPTLPTKTGTGTTTGPTTTTPGPATGAPSPSPSTTSPLIWAPPTLINPITIKVQSGLDPEEIDLNPSLDYILRMPATAVSGTIEINGGHNVVLVGGEVTVPSTADQTDNGADGTDTAIYVRGSTGTVHIEGVQIDGQTNTMFDGIDVNAPQATVQVENVRMTGLWGSYSTEHADAIQTWGGVKDLEVDDLTVQGDYQGLSVSPDLGSVGSAQFDNIDLTAEPWPAALAAESSGGGTMIWLTRGSNTCTTTPMSFSNVYVDDATGGRVATGDTVWPATNSTLPCPAHQTGDRVSWPALPISGVVTLGVPPNGPFVPAGSAGIGYQSPGYAAP
jgi:hypothetical protein